MLRRFIGILFVALVSTGIGIGWGLIIRSAYPWLVVPAILAGLFVIYLAVYWTVRFINGDLRW